MTVMDDNGLVHGVTFLGLLQCSSSYPLPVIRADAKLEYGVITCLTCAARGSS